jgi:lipopolysaccharide transport system ATP-binding protein
LSTVIECQNISKKFILHKERSKSLQEIFVNGFRRRKKEDFWALRDISFAVEEGEVLGIVGANGSGKSTLLKLLARIILPTTGKITIHGRLEALIELGAGFHPELTGRENIFLSGSIRGIDRRTMRSYIDDIIDFSGLGQFIDIPVKHYSSGMYVRLGFSLNVMLNPDILLVDEVLAVGDAIFRKKCITWLQGLQDSNKTIILVSHEANAIRALCTRALFLKRGELITIGTPKEVLDLYHASLQLPSQVQTENILAVDGKKRYGIGRVRIETAELLNGSGHGADCFAVGEEMIIRVVFLCLEQVSDLIIGITIRTDLGIDVYATNNEYQGLDLGTFAKGDTVEICFRQYVLLGQGSYLLNVGVAQKTSSGVVKLDYIYDATQFSVVGDGCSFGICDLRSTIQSCILQY